MLHLKDFAKRLRSKLAVLASKSGTGFVECKILCTQLGRYPLLLTVSEA